jgi:hypothetical protein
VSEEKAADEQQPKGELEAARNAVTPTAVARGQHRVRNSKRADPGVDHALRSGAQHGKSAQNAAGVVLAPAKRQR